MSTSRQPLLPIPTFFSLGLLLGVATMTPQPSWGQTLNPAPATPLQAGHVFKDCVDCPELVVIPEGHFVMGSDDHKVEQPKHTVKLKSFAIGRYEVTQEEWKAVMGSPPRHVQPCGKRCPVTQVSWDDLQKYLKKLSAKTGQPYRLPTEAEWEYAAKGGTSTPYPWGKELGKNKAHCYTCESPWSKDTPAPVGSFKPNGFGVYDMNGNVWEWVQDLWHEDYKGAPNDGSAWAATDQRTSHVVRGGSWISNAFQVRSTFRYDELPAERSGDIGFRVARDLR